MRHARLDPLPGRLLYLGPEQTLHVPYNPEPPLTLTITRDDQLERGGQAWSLSSSEVALMNLLRLSDGHPLMQQRELFPHLGHANDRTKANHLSHMLNEPHGLNRNVLHEPRMARRAIITDGTTPALVRLGRTLRFIDERENSNPGDVHYRTEYAHLVTPAPLPEGLPAREGKVYSADRHSAHYRALCLTGGTLVAAGVVSLRYAYAISLKYGPADFLRGTLLPRHSGERIAYEQLFPLPAEHQPPAPANAAFICKLLGGSRRTVEGRILRLATKKLVEAAQAQ